MQRQFAQVFAFERQDVEGIELDLGVMPAGVQSIEIGMPSTPSSTASPSMTNELERFRRAASTIHG